MATTSQISEVLQLYYEKDTQQTFSDEFWAESEISKSKNLRWEGDKVKIHVHNGRNTGAAAVAENAALPTAGYQSTVQGEVDRKFVYGRIKLTGQAIYSAQSEAHAFKAVLDFEMERMARDITSLRSFHLYTGQTVANNAAGHALWDTSFEGCNAVRARVISAPGANVVLGHPGGIPSTGAGALVPTDGGTRYLNVDDPIAWGTASEIMGTPSGYGTVATINRSTSTITVTAAGGSTAPAVGDYIVRGWVNSNEGNQAPVGLGALLQFRSGNFQNIAYNSEQWSGRVTPNAGTLFASPGTAPLTLDAMHLMVQQIREQSGRSVDLMIAHPSISREYVDLLDSQVRYAPKEMTAGYETLTFSSGKPVKFIFDNDCPYGVIFFLNKASLMWAVNRPWMWEKTDGNVLRQDLNDLDAFQARYVSYYNLAFKSLNCNGALYGVDVSGTIK